MEFTMYKWIVSALLFIVFASQPVLAQTQQPCILTNSAASFVIYDAPGAQHPAGWYIDADGLEWPWSMNSYNENSVTSWIVIDGNLYFQVSGFDENYELRQGWAEVQNRHISDNCAELPNASNSQPLREYFGIT